MSLVVLLDAGPLGQVTNPAASPENDRCNEWLKSMLAGGVPVVVPEVSDFEVRRELLRAGKVRGLRQLDRFKAVLAYHPITTETMLLAAELWAEARRRGRPTADPKELDCDVILAAQALLVARSGDEPVIATTNVGHLAQFVDARPWQAIS